VRDGVRRKARLKEPVREQVVIRYELPEATLPTTHPARVLWRVLETFDLSEFERGVRSVDGKAGRPTHSPRMLLCLWLYAISRGVGSARELARRVLEDRSFEWIAGGVTVSHDVLRDFRIQHGEALEHLMSSVLGALLQQDLVTLERVAVDGTRVRASASAPSFRRAESLQACREQARLHVKAVLATAHETTRARSAAEAAARSFESRVEGAIAAVAELRELGREEPRASTTDPDARIMKMPDGGFRPAYNVQFAVAGSELGGPRTIVGVRVSQKGNDYDGLDAVADDVHKRTGKYPSAVLADGGFASHAGIEALTERGIRPLVVVPEHEKKPKRRKPSAEVAAWRLDMESSDAKQALRSRASLVELTNAQTKGRLGLGHLLLRGVGKVTCVVLLTAIASNLLQHAARLLA
jgi:transposase